MSSLIVCRNKPVPGFWFYSLEARSVPTQMALVIVPP